MNTTNLSHLYSAQQLAQTHALEARHAQEKEDKRGADMQQPTTLTGKAVFNPTAGIRNAATKAAAMAKTLTQRSKKVKKPADSELGGVASRLIQQMQDSGDKEDLSDEYRDPLEQYALFGEVLALLDERLSGKGEDAPKNEKEAEQLRTIKAKIETKRETLLQKQSPEQREKLEAGIQASHGMQRIFDSLATSGGPKADAIKELRSFFCDKGNGKSLESLSPRAILKNLRANYGVKNFKSALTNVRKAFSGSASLDDRKPLNGNGARVWLSMSDAAACHQLQSSYLIAEELWNSLFLAMLHEPKKDPLELTDMLFDIPTASARQTSEVFAALVEYDKLPPQQQQKVCEAFLKGIESMPHTWWTPEGMQARVDLIGNLRSMIHGMHTEDSREKKEAERTEKNLRAAPVVPSGTPVSAAA